MGLSILLSDAEIGYLPGIPWLCGKLPIIFNILLAALFHLLSTDALGNSVLTQD